MSQPPSKRSRTLKDFFSSRHETPDEPADSAEATTVTVTVSSSSITTSTSGGDASVTFSPTVIVTRGRDLGDGEGAVRPLTFPSDIAQSTNDVPAQTMLSRYPSTIFGDKTRSFQSSWFQSHPWLEYSVERDSCYCYPCRLSNTEPTDSAFANPSGYHDWKHAPGKKGSLSLHATSVTHSSAMVAWQQFQLNREHRTSLPHRMDRLGEQCLRSNRHYIKTIAEIVLLCARQEIALRGHNESIDSQNPGNFRAILDLVARHDDSFCQSYKGAARKALYTSPEIQNELALIISNMIREVICTDIRDVVYYSLLVDESKDVSKKEQMSIMLRYVQEGNVHERFIGFVHISKLDANSLTQYISETLATCSLSLEGCISQCYDGASVMSGKCAGVQRRIKELAPCAIYTHCCAHRLNLVLVDCSKSVSIVSEFLRLLE